MFNLIKEIAQLIVATTKEIAKLTMHAPAPEYRDSHFFVKYDKKGNLTESHCVYCKQIQSEASKYCPGLPRA